MIIPEPLHAITVTAFVAARTLDFPPRMRSKCNAEACCNASPIPANAHRIPPAVYARRLHSSWEGLARPKTTIPSTWSIYSARMRPSISWPATRWRCFCSRSALLSVCLKRRLSICRHVLHAGGETGSPPLSVPDIHRPRHPIRGAAHEARGTRFPQVQNRVRELSHHRQWRKFGLSLGSRPQLRGR